MSACPALMLCLGRRPSDSQGEESSSFVRLSTRLLHEGDAHVCLLSHPRSVVTKILSSKVLRRWEPHRLSLRRDAIVSLTPTGFVESPVAYSDVEEVHAVDSGQRHCVRLVLSEGSLLLQVANAYLRDQWLHSILWKKNLSRYREVLSRPMKQEAVLKEIKALVELSQCCPLRDESVTREPLELAASLPPLEDDAALLEALSPLLEAAPSPPPALCARMAAACRSRPLPPPVAERVGAAVGRVLRRTVDFGRAPPTRLLAERFLLALGPPSAPPFVAGLHGAASACPHPRVLPNLVAVALALGAAGGEALGCCIAVLDKASEYDDWLPGLAQLLRPVPFPEEVVADRGFLRDMIGVLRRVGPDPRCEVHSGVLGVREGKDGWFQLLSTEHGELWGLVLKTLLGCCCRRKQFLRGLMEEHLGPCLLQALRDCDAALEALCLALEWDLLEAEEQREQVAATLRSTEEGRRRYAALCLRREHLRELQQKGGPRKLTLPSRSTDADMAKLLSCGSFGNLECLSLAFTHVTSACAEQLIKLPSLRYLNLWATQFGDAGLVMICEHLQRLQVLNLCETQVSDRGISALSSMTSLRKLNLNSTKLSSQTFQELRRHLPALQEVDVRYTEAW